MKRLLLAVLFLSPLESNAVEQKRLVYGENTKITNMDPYTANESAAHRLSDLVFESLVTTGPGGSYEPLLAKSWIIENGGTSVHVKLKDKVFWHKEASNALKPLTAEDVASTIKAITNPKSTIPNGERFKVLKSTEVLSQKSIRIHFSRALAQPLKYLMFKVLPFHKLESAEALTKEHTLSQHPIGTGPFAFASTNPQGEVLLKRNNFYHGKLADIKEIVMKPFIDNSIMTQSLMYSSLDLVTYISPRDIKEVSGDRNLGLVPYDAQSFSFVAMNQKNPLLKDKRVRQAINYAVNRQEMLNAFFQGKGHLITGPFSPTSWAYNLSVPGYEMDLERARGLLKQAGFEDRNNDGVVENRKGKTLTLDFAVPLAGESEVTKRIVLAYQSYLAKAGIRVKLKFMDWVLWKEEVLGKHNYDLSIASWDFDDSSNISSLFHSQSAKSWGNNFVNFKNSNVDSMLTEASASNDFDKRQAIYKKLHSIISDEAPYTFLWTLQHHAGHQKRIRGVRIEPFSFFKHVAYWKVNRNHGRK